MRLASARLGTITAPFSPPFCNLANDTSESSPSRSLSLWQPEQYLAKIGATSFVKSGDFDSAAAHWTITASDPTTAIKKDDNRIELIIRQKISRKGAKTQRKNSGLRTLRKFVEQEITEATENYNYSVLSVASCSNCLSAFIFAPSRLCVRYSLHFDQWLNKNSRLLRTPQ